MRIYLTFLICMFAAVAAPAFTYVTNTVGISSQTIPGDYADFTFRWSGYDDIVLRLQVTQSGVTLSNVSFRMSYPRRGTIFLEEQGTHVNATTRSWTIVRTNLPPAGAYFCEFLNWESAATNAPTRILGAGKVRIEQSVWQNTTQSTWVNPLAGTALGPPTHTITNQTSWPFVNRIQWQGTNIVTAANAVNFNDTDFTVSSNAGAVAAITVAVGASGDSITVTNGAATDPDFNASGNVDPTMTGGTGIAFNVEAASLTAAELGTDSVSADELNAGGVTAELEAVLDHDNLVGFVAGEHIAEGAIDHGSIAGLGDDDHSAYVDKAGDTMTGSLNIQGGDLRITNSAATITMHATSPGGSKWNLWVGSDEFSIRSEDLSDDLFQANSNGLVSVGGGGLGNGFVFDTATQRGGFNSLPPYTHDLVLLGSVTGVLWAGDGSTLFDLDDDLVNFDDADANWTATAVGPALEELDNQIGGGVPNQATGKVEWSQLVGVPAAFADNTDPTLDQVGDPAAAKVFVHGDGETLQFSTAEDGGHFMQIKGTDTSLAANTTNLLITTAADADAEYVPLAIQDDANGVPNNLMVVNYQGNLTLAGSRIQLGDANSYWDFTNAVADSVIWAADAFDYMEYDRADNAWRWHIGATPNPQVEIVEGTMRNHSESTASTRGVVHSQHNDGTDGARMRMRKSRGTLAAPTVVSSGDNVGRLMAEPYDGAGYLEMGAAEFKVTGTVAANRTPTQFSVWTATDAAPSVLTERLVIGPSGTMTLTHDTTGDATVAFPAGSISGTEILDDTVTAVDIRATYGALIEFNANKGITIEDARVTNYTHSITQNMTANTAAGTLINDEAGIYEVYLQLRANAGNDSSYGEYMTNGVAIAAGIGGPVRERSWHSVPRHSSVRTLISLPAGTTNTIYYNAGTAGANAIYDAVLMMKRWD